MDDTTKQISEEERLNSLLDELTELYSGTPETAVARGNLVHMMLDPHYGFSGGASDSYGKSILFFDELSFSMMDSHQRAELVLSIELKQAAKDYNSHSLDNAIIFGKVQPQQNPSSFASCAL